MLITKKCLWCHTEFNNRRKTPNIKHGSYSIGKIQFSKIKFCSSKCSDRGKYGLNKYKIEDKILYIFTKKGTILADSDEAKNLLRVKWNIDTTGYACCTPLDLDKTKYRRMHTQILGRKKGFLVDHINRNKIDNRRENLRFATQSENLRNGTKFRIRWDRFRKRWTAALSVNGKNIFLGRYKDKLEAVEARRKGEKKYWGKVYH